MKEMSSRFGYIPPKIHEMASLQEAVLCLISAICSLECARFIQFVETHPVSNDPNARHLAAFLPPYTLADWAAGKVPDEVSKGREKGAGEALRRWAFSIIELNTFFRSFGIVDPIGYLEKQNLVIRSTKDFGWDVNKPIVTQKFGVAL